MKKTAIAAVMVAVQIGAAQAAEPIFSNPVPEYQDHYTRAATAAAAASCAIAAYRMGAITLDQAKAASAMPEETDNPGGVDPQTAEFVSRVTGVCNEILKLMAVKAER